MFASRHLGGIGWRKEWRGMEVAQRLRAEIDKNRDSIIRKRSLYKKEQKGGLQHELSTWGTNAFSRVNFFSHPNLCPGGSSCISRKEKLGKR